MSVFFFVLAICASVLVVTGVITFTLGVFGIIGIIGMIVLKPKSMNKAYWKGYEIPSQLSLFFPFSLVCFYSAYLLFHTGKLNNAWYVILIFALSFICLYWLLLIITRRPRFSIIKRKKKK